MPKELLSYRDNLEQILKFTEGRQLLTVSEVAKFCGRDRRTVMRIFSIDKNGISAARLARMLSL